MAGEGDKLDLILQRLDKLGADMQAVRSDLGGVTTDIAAVKANVESLRLTVDAIKESVDNKIAALKDSLETKIDDDIDQMKTMLKDGLRDDVRDAVNDLFGDIDITAICAKQQSMEKELQELRSLVDSPFNPDRSVVVYGLRINEGETLDAKVDWLLQMILELTINPKFFEKTDDHADDKPGVIKIELSSKWDKIAVLKAKRKCLDHDTTKNVIIRSCDSHDARVSKLNARFFISKLKDGKDYIVTSHGLVKRKMDSDGGSGATPP